jgi:membrane protease YdiL (CAAX protease family)
MFKLFFVIFTGKIINFLMCFTKMQQPLRHHPFVQLLTVAFSMLGCFILFSLIAFFLAIPIFGVSLTELVQYFETGILQEHIVLLKYFQTVQSIGMFVFPPFIIAWLYSRNSADYLKTNILPRFSSYILVLGIVFFSLPFIQYLSQLNQGISFPEGLKGLESWLMNKEESAQELTRRFLSADNWQGLLVNILIVGVLPAIGEEFVFRGIVQRIFSKWTRNAHLGILIAAFFFSAMHIQFYGLFPRFFLGVLFGYLLLWSGSIWLPVFGHFVNNASAVVVFYFTKDVNFSAGKYEAMNIPDVAIYISAGLILILSFLIYYKEKQSAYK